MRRYLAAAVEHEEYDRFAHKCREKGLNNISAGVRAACEEWLKNTTN